MRRNSDELIRSIWRRAGQGDLEAAREYVRVLERVHGERPVWEPEPPPTLEQWASSTAESILRAVAGRSRDEEFERWRVRLASRTTEIGRAIDAAVDASVENMAAAYARSVAERIAFDMADADDIDQRLADRISGYLVRTLAEVLRDDHIGWRTRLERRVRQILRRGP